VLTVTNLSANYEHESSRSVEQNSSSEESLQFLNTRIFTMKQLSISFLFVVSYQITARGSKLKITITVQIYTSYRAVGTLHAAMSVKSEGFKLL
jgi:hypothetical protein